MILFKKEETLYLVNGKMNKLPDLPKKNKKQEANFSLVFRDYITKNPIKYPCWFEIKDTRGAKNFNLREWKQEQRDFAESLKYSKKGILVRTDGVRGLPDYKFAFHEPTFVVIKFNEGFSIIEAETLNMQKGSTIDFESSKEISHITVKKEKPHRE